jgi:hypothetical protein
MYNFLNCSLSPSSRRLKVVNVPINLSVFSCEHNKKFRVPQRRHYLTTWRTIRFSRRTLIHDVTWTFKWLPIFTVLKDCKTRSLELRREKWVASRERSLFVKEIEDCDPQSKDRDNFALWCSSIHALLPHNSTFYKFKYHIIFQNSVSEECPIFSCRGTR